MSSGLGYIMEQKIDPVIDSNSSPYAVSKFPGSKTNGAKIPFKNIKSKQHEVKTTGILASFP